MISQFGFTGRSGSVKVPFLKVLRLYIERATLKLGCIKRKGVFGADLNIESPDHLGIVLYNDIFYSIQLFFTRTAMALVGLRMHTQTRA